MWMITQHYILICHVLFVGLGDMCFSGMQEERGRGLQYQMG